MVEIDHEFDCMIDFDSDFDVDLDSNLYLKGWTGFDYVFFHHQLLFVFFSMKLDLVT